MPGDNSTPVKIGPWAGGLNNVSTAGESADNQAVELINLELALDTSLVSRPPIEAIPGTFMVQSIGWEVLGIYRVTSAQWYAVILKPTSATTWDVLLYQSADFTTAPTTVKSITGVANKIVSMVQYNDYIYLNVNTGASDTGGRFKIGVGYSAIAAMPRGNSMVVFKDRLFITASGAAADGNTLYFSTVDGTGSHPETWNTSTDFINIFPGIGGMNTALLPLSGYLLIFKEDATFRFSYASKPAGGIVEIIGTGIGCSGPTGCVAFDNYAIVYSQGRVYQLINEKFTQLNLNVAFTVAANSPDALAPGVDMSVVNRRIIVRYLNTMFAYSVDTEAWSQWQVVAGTPGKFFPLPADPSIAAPSTYIAASKGTSQLVGTNKITDPSFLNSGYNAARLANPASVGSATLASNVITVTKTGAGFPELFLNKKGASTDYDIPVGSSQQFTFTATVTSTDPGTNKAELHYNFLYRDGSTSTTIVNLVAADLPSVSKTFTIPDKAILASISLKSASTAAVGNAFTVTGPSVTRASVASPVGVLRLTENFQNAYQNTTAIEYIECWIKTKSYDYQANSVFKRLFLWGADVKTPRDIELSAYPLGNNIPVTWDQMEAYTWSQLDQGTWANPLSWLNMTRTVVDSVPAQVGISENGRFFVKGKGQLRFRQIQFSAKMTTLGNSDTGPVKLFSFTTYTAARQLVVDKATG